MILSAGIHEVLGIASMSLILRHQYRARDYPIRPPKADHTQNRPSAPPLCPLPTRMSSHIACSAKKHTTKLILSQLIRSRSIAQCILYMKPNNIHHKASSINTTAFVDNDSDIQHRSLQQSNAIIPRLTKETSNLASPIRSHHSFGQYQNPSSYAA